MPHSFFEVIVCVLMCTKHDSEKYILKKTKLDPSRVVYFESVLNRAILLFLRFMNIQDVSEDTVLKKKTCLDIYKNSEVLSYSKLRKGCKFYEARQPVKHRVNFKVKKGQPPLA